MVRAARGSPLWGALHEPLTPMLGSPGVLIIRRFDAPSDVLWRVWNESDLARRWWCPERFTVLEHRFDARPDGVWHTILRAPDGEVYRRHGRFREVLPGARFTFSLVWDDHPTDSEVWVTVTLEESGGRTLLTLRHGPYPNVEWRRAEEEAWHAAFDQLETIVGCSRGASAVHCAAASGR